jgi:hypothetical protein
MGHQRPIDSPSLKKNRVGVSAVAPGTMLKWNGAADTQTMLAHSTGYDYGKETGINTKPSTSFKCGNSSWRSRMVVVISSGPAQWFGD